MNAQTIIVRGSSAGGAYLGDVLAKAKAKRRGKDRSVDDALRSSWARRTEREVEAVLADWRAAAAKKIPAAYAEATKAVGEEAVDRILASLDLDQFSVEILEALTPGIKRAFEEAGIAAVAEVGFTGDDRHPSGITDHFDQAAGNYASSHAADLVTGIRDTTRSDLRELIVSALEDGASSTSLADSIEDLFGFSQARAQMISRTELAFAHVQGNLAGYRESGLVEGKRWLVSQDNVCELCEALDGQVVGIDEDFDSEGEAVDAPPLHPNCRCDVLPVLEGEAQS